MGTDMPGHVPWTRHFYLAQTRHSNFALTELLRGMGAMSTYRSAGPSNRFDFPRLVTSGQAKISASLRRQTDASSDTTRIGVVITAVDGDAASCVKEAVASNGGEVRGALGQQSVLATLNRQGIEDVAARADVQAVDAEFDDAPPP